MVHITATKLNCSYFQMVFAIITEHSPFKVIWHSQTNSSIGLSSKGLSKAWTLKSYCLSYHNTPATPTQSTQYSTVYFHPPHSSHSPLFSLSTELFMSLFAHAGQVLLHSLLWNPISQPLSLNCSAFPSDRSSPLTALTLTPQRLICASHKQNTFTYIH